MMNLMGNWRNREGRREKDRFKVNVIYFCSGFFAGIIVAIIAIAK